ncbi:hypothetical protein Ade02nite_81640 [Paractinoplanes deccanensis]|uniref:HupE/UreJ family protein n=1 Tax=Paractinoplanes deccanensis TaxID=113561 RepID=A0ABQ3YHQ2_9ACTN|nr:HupE/UreJ family protein [Actinoplanes deccanensis]GID79523.1 hypothetical protein Ade02nite_81640 [Actinoplanes deccanensis]
MLAHGVRPPPDDGIFDFGWLGFTHMLTGWDHLLFIAGVVLLAWHPKRALGLLSLFALGHSITLITATLAGWRLDPALVDVVIAVSVGVVGTIGLIGRPRRFWWFGLLVLAFGLVHGLGLATRFQALTLPPGAELSRLLAFNAGVEIGQAVAVYLIYLLGEALTYRPKWPRIERASFGGLTVVGLALGAALTVARL